MQQEQISSDSASLPTEWQSGFEKIYPELANITDPQWINIFQNVDYIQVPPGMVLLDQDKICSGFVMLLSGDVRVFQYAPDGREITLYRLAPGDTCVMSLNSILHNKQFGAVAKTESDISAIVLTPPQFYSALAVSEKFRIHIMASMSDRYCDMLTVVEETAFKRFDMRLACCLGRLFEKSQTHTLNITHQELARELGTTREVVSRALKEMERQQCISLSRGSIHIASPEGLKWYQQEKK